MIFPWMILAVIFLIVTNVLGRYFFDIRFDFAVDVSWQLYAAGIIFGACYALTKGSHIRTDLYYKVLSERTKTTIDLVAYILAVIPSFGALAYISIFDTIRSIELNEKSSATMDQLIIWPMKLALTLGLLLFLWKGLAEIRKCWKCLRS